MFFEGVRGPGEGDPGDTQFALGLARTTTDQIDGPWETYSENPILVDMPGISIRRWMEKSEVGWC